MTIRVKTALALVFTLAVPAFAHAQENVRESADLVDYSYNVGRSTSPATYDPADHDSWSGRVDDVRFDRADDELRFGISHNGGGHNESTRLKIALNFYLNGRLYVAPAGDTFTLTSNNRLLANRRSNVTFEGDALRDQGVPYPRPDEWDEVRITLYRVGIVEEEYEIACEGECTYHRPDAPMRPVLPESCKSNLGRVSGTVTRSGRWDGSCESVHYSNRRFARYYSFTLSRNALVTIDLTSSSVDTLLALRNGSGTGSGLLESDDDSGSGLNARITRRLAAGTYTIEATQYTAETGPFTLTLEVGPVQVPALPAVGLGLLGLWLAALGIWLRTNLSSGRGGRGANGYGVAP